MRIVSATLLALKIPFVESFRHTAKTRTFSDSIVVRLTAENGVTGYGEGLARPYVTGETVESSLEYMQKVLWPAIARIDDFEISQNSNPIQSLASMERSLPDKRAQGVVAWNAARAAFELALVDCLLKNQKLSLSKILPPRRTTVIYSGVITASATEKVIQVAKYFKLFGITQVKVKIDGKNDRKRLLAVRETMGKDASIRIDANGAFSLNGAAKILNGLSDIRIDCVEQPIPRGNPSDLAKLKSELKIPIMTDESLVTVEDAEQLISAKACDFFNLRISKCGGILRTLQIARLAQEAGIKLQLGAQVGETVILSAAGRHVAAYLDRVDFVEGSYGTMLLTEDIGDEKINFGHGGKAPVLRGEGLGVRVREEILRKYVDKVIECGKV